MSPTGGATALGCSGGTKALWGTRPGVFEIEAAGLEEAWGAAAKLRIKLRPSALTTGRGAAPAFTGVTWMTKRSPSPSRLIVSKPASGRASRCGPRRRLVGLGRISWPSQPKLLFELLQLGAGASALDHHLNGVRQAANLELQRPRRWQRPEPGSPIPLIPPSPPALIQPDGSEITGRNIQAMGRDYGEQGEVAMPSSVAFTIYSASVQHFFCRPFRRRS